MSRERCFEGGVRKRDLEQVVLLIQVVGAVDLEEVLESQSKPIESNTNVPGMEMTASAPSVDPTCHQLVSDEKLTLWRLAPLDIDALPVRTLHLGDLVDDFCRDLRSFEPAELVWCFTQQNFGNSKCRI